MMKANHLPQADLLDILFEHRNKAYGAYALRRQYPAHLFKALCMCLSVAAIFVFLISFNRHNKLLSVPFLQVVDTVTVEPIQSPDPLPTVRPSGPAPTQNTIKDFVPLIVPNDIPIEDSVPTFEERSQNVTGRENKSVDGNGPEINTGNGQVFRTAEPETVPVVPEIYDFGAVEEPAIFPGGNKALLRFMERNLRDPRNGDEEPGETIRVQVKFVVGKDGQPDGFSVVGSGGELFDQEVLRVLRLMPRWKPARQHNQQVAMFFIMPVSFAVNGYE